ncbi:MAG: 50S ribosomal protein L9, partial [Spirochaetales bacterium]|nr:50S ribosomal protein L9 [Spirochaetales bacterium]
LGYSKQNVAYFEQRKEVIEKRKQEKREEAKSFREKIESKVLEIEVPAGDTGRLFGSVNSATIAEKLASEGITIERKKIDVPESSIKMVGEYRVRLRLYGDEVAGIKVIVYPVGGKKAAAAATAAAEAQAQEQTHSKEKGAARKRAEADAEATVEPEATAAAEPEAEAPAETGDGAEET